MTTNTTEKLRERREWPGKLTRVDAIKLLDRITNNDDPYWEHKVEDWYDEATDTMPTIYHLIAALGVSEAEYKSLHPGANINWPAALTPQQDAGLREALEFYANEENYKPQENPFPDIVDQALIDGNVHFDKGKRARQALSVSPWREDIPLRTDWENAPRDHSPVLLKFKPGAHDSNFGRWPVYIVARHSGLPEDDSFDYNGWGMPGHGGWLDDDFEGFLPLPQPPATKD